MQYVDHEPDEECKQTARKIMRCPQWRVRLRELTKMDDAQNYRALIYAFANGWIVYEE